MVFHRGTTRFAVPVHGLSARFCQTLSLDDGALPEIPTDPRRGCSGFCSGSRQSLCFAAGFHQPPALCQDSPQDLMPSSHFAMLLESIITAGRRSVKRARANFRIIYRSDGFPFGKKPLSAVITPPIRAKITPQRRIFAQKCTSASSAVTRLTGLDAASTSSQKRPLIAV